MLMVSLLMVSVMACCSASCPLWFKANRTTGECSCGDTLGGLILCNQNTKRVKMMICYGMTYNQLTNDTAVGYCLYTCQRKMLSCGAFNRLPQNSQQINTEMCGKLNRTGQLCGNCKEGYGLPVYSYTIRCVPCSNDKFMGSLFKYLAVAFLPPTGFYLFVVIFKISVTSGYMVGYIAITQIITTPTLLRGMALGDEGNNNHYVMIWFMLWNLDALRLVIPPFCLHPKVTILHILGLDYIIGVYPLFLVFLTHMAVKMHARFPAVEKMWRPPNRMLVRVRREWDTHGTLPQALATFMILSYAKILNVSIDLLTPVFLKNIEGETLPQSYLYLNGEILFFGRQHLPYGILAIVMFTVFNLLPMLLLLLHPCQCFLRCMNKSRLDITALQPLVNTFQACYRPQYRYFAGIYLLIRVCFLVTTASVKNSTAYPMLGFFFLTLTLALTLFMPYKKKIHNQIDSLFFLFSAGGCFVACANFLHQSEPQIPERPIFIIMMAPLLFIPLLYGPATLLAKAMPQRSFSLLKRCWQYISHRIKHEQENEDEAFLQQVETERSITRPLTFITTDS
jgi:hypothetical protein